MSGWGSDRIRPCKFNWYRAHIPGSFQPMGPQSINVRKKNGWLCCKLVLLSAGKEGGRVPFTSKSYFTFYSFRVIFLKSLNSIVLLSWHFSCITAFKAGGLMSSSERAVYFDLVFASQAKHRQFFLIDKGCRGRVPPERKSCTQDGSSNYFFLLYKNNYS